MYVGGSKVDLGEMNIKNFGGGTVSVLNTKVSLFEDISLYRTLHQVPKVSTIEGFHCIQDTSPGPQGVHNRGVTLYTGHFTRSPRCPQ